MLTRIHRLLLCLFVLASAPHAHSGERAAPNWRLPTLGGVQLWTDVRWRAGWRIQQHAWTGHHRLLDPANTRHAWGTFDACERRLEPLVAAERDAPNPPADPTADNASIATDTHLVVLVHGLGRSRRSMGPLKRALQHEGYDVLDFSYASTQASLWVQAQHLAACLDHAGSVDRISFVTHSLGGLIVRALLGESAPRADSPPAGWRSRLGRLVQLGPPNQGSVLAGRLGPLLGFLGPAATEIRSAPELGVPPLPFAVVAGRWGSSGNPLVPGPDDGVVSTAETHLPGMDAHIEVPVCHTYLMRDPGVVRAALRYLDRTEPSPGAR